MNRPDPLTSPLAPAQRWVYSLLLACAFVLPYTRVNGWSFPIALPWVLFFSWRLQPRRTLEFLGLKWKRNDWVCALLILAIGIPAAHEAILFFLTRNALHLDSTRWTGLLRWRPVFQVLSEEMAFRAVLLGSWIRWTARGREHPAAKIRWIEWGVAFAFGFGHAPFYFLKDGSQLTLLTLLNLTLMGWLCNRAYTSTRTIAIPVAIHLAWNWTRFGADIAGPTGILPEGQSFYALEGAQEITLLLIVLCLVIGTFFRLKLRDLNGLKLYLKNL